MSDFDQDLKRLLSEEDEAFITDAMDEAGVYKTVLQSFKGPGRSMSLMASVGIMIFCALLFFFVWKFFQAQTIKDQIMFAAMVVMMNTAQCTLKLWNNMHLNRRTVTREIKLLQLAIAKAGHLS